MSMQLERLGLKTGRKPTRAQYKKARRVANRDAKNAFFAAGGTRKDYAKAKARASRETVRDAFEDCVTTAVEEMDTDATDFTAGSALATGISAYYKMDGDFTDASGSVNPATAFFAEKGWLDPNADMAAGKKSEPFDLLWDHSGGAVVAKTHPNANNYIYIGTGSYNTGDDCKITWKLNIVSGQKITWLFKIGNYLNANKRQFQVLTSSDGVSFSSCHGPVQQAGVQEYEGECALPPSFTGTYYLQSRIFGSFGNSMLVGWNKIQIGCLNCGSMTIRGKRKGLKVGPAFGRGRAKQGGSFDGSTRASLCISQITMGNTNRFSTQAWFRTKSKGGSQVIVGANHERGGSPGRFLYTDGGTLGFFLNTLIDETYAAGKVNDGRWHHAVAVRDNDSAKLYLDGEEVSTGTANAPERDFSKLSIGGMGGCGGNLAAASQTETTEPFDGAIDEPVEILQNTISDRACRIAQHGSEAHSC